MIEILCFNTIESNEQLIGFLNHKAEVGGHISDLNNANYYKIPILKEGYINKSKYIKNDKIMFVWED